LAIKNTEQCATHSPQFHEANLQLLDALDRLHSAERHFQDRFRARTSAPPEQNPPFIKNGDGHLEKHQ
jgi:hypothetical protein